MDLLINGVATEQAGVSTVSELLITLGYRDAFVAIAVNRLCVKRSEFSVTALKAGDEVEILAPMAGG